MPLMLLLGVGEHLVRILSSRSSESSYLLCNLVLTWAKLVRTVQQASLLSVWLEWCLPSLASIAQWLPRPHPERCLNVAPLLPKRLPRQKLEGSVVARHEAFSSLMTELEHWLNDTDAGLLTQPSCVSLLPLASRLLAQFFPRTLRPVLRTLVAVELVRDRSNFMALRADLLNKI